MAAFDRILSGLPGLDKALDNIRLGKQTVMGIIRSRQAQK